MRLPAPSHITFREVGYWAAAGISRGWSELRHPWKEPPRPEASEDPLAAIDIQRRSQRCIARHYKSPLKSSKAWKIAMLHSSALSTSCLTRKWPRHNSSPASSSGTETSSVIKRITYPHQRRAQNHEISMELYFRGAQAFT